MTGTNEKSEKACKEKSNMDEITKRESLFPSLAEDWPVHKHFSDLMLRNRRRN